MEVPLKSILDALLPTQCLLCGDSGGHIINLCDGCLGDLPRIESICLRCGATQLTPSTDNDCPACRRRPSPLSRTLSVFRYEPPVSDLIHTLKFGRRLAAAATLGVLLAERVLNSISQVPDVILPVPLHFARFRERGFNQALEIAGSGSRHYQIARPLARDLQRPMFATAIRRHRATLPQARMGSPTARRRNVRGAFELARPAACLHGVSHVAIVDDVLTTGATAGALARLLRRHGVENVEVWTVARRYPDRTIWAG